MAGAGRAGQAGSHVSRGELPKSKLGSARSCRAQAHACAKAPRAFPKSQTACYKRNFKPDHRKATYTDGNSNEEWPQTRTNGSGVRRRQAGARAPRSWTSRRIALVCEKEFGPGHLSAIFDRRRERGPDIAPSTRCRDVGAGFELLPTYAVRRKNVVWREGPNRQNIVGGLA